MKRKASIEKSGGEEKGGKLEINFGGNFIVVSIGIILIMVVVVLWWIYGHHYVWVPLETTFKAGV